MFLLDFHALPAIKRLLKQLCIVSAAFVQNVRIPVSYTHLDVYKRQVNGVATKYTLHGKNVVHMTSGTDELHFFYYAQNRPAVVVYLSLIHIFQHVLVWRHGSGAEEASAAEKHCAAGQRRHVQL